MRKVAIVLFAALSLGCPDSPVPGPGPAVPTTGCGGSMPPAMGVTGVGGVGSGAPVPDLGSAPDSTSGSEGLDGTSTAPATTGGTSTGGGTNASTGPSKGQDTTADGRTTATSQNVPGTTIG